MSTQHYSVTQHPVETLLTWVKSVEIVIPKSRHPFFCDPMKLRNLLDSVCQVCSVGFPIAMCNPTVKLKDGTPSADKCMTQQVVAST
jgi:hypothetical protein